MNVYLPLINKHYGNVNKVPAYKKNGRIYRQEYNVGW